MALMNSGIFIAQERSQLWYLVIKNFKSMIREKSQLIWLLGYPMLFIGLFSDREEAKTHAKT